jgi:hypothetical protein
MSPEKTNELHIGATGYSRERTLSTHCTGGWVSLRAVWTQRLEDKICCICRGSNPVFPVCNQTFTELLWILGWYIIF